jgi:hypothetical protein
VATAGGVAFAPTRPGHCGSGLDAACTPRRLPCHLGGGRWRSEGKPLHRLDQRHSLAMAGHHLPHTGRNQFSIVCMNLLILQFEYIITILQYEVCEMHRSSWS